MQFQSTILVVEDEFPIRAGIIELLADAGYDVVGAENGSHALTLLGDDISPDMIISDVIMPKINGYQLYDRLRRDERYTRVPFVFLTAKRDPEDIRYGKELGADDYLVKPFDSADLLAIVYGKLRRYEQLHPNGLKSQASAPSGQYTLANVTLDLGTREAWANDEKLHLTPSEFFILKRLFMANGKVVEYEELLPASNTDAEERAESSSRIVRYHIRNLRSKLAELDTTDGLILNIRSHGYRLYTEPRRL